jgi:hypothetical protein
LRICTPLLIFSEGFPGGVEQKPYASLLHHVGDQLKKVGSDPRRKTAGHHDDAGTFDSFFEYIEAMLLLGFG